MFLEFPCVRKCSVRIAVVEVLIPIGVVLRFLLDDLHKWNHSGIVIIERIANEGSSQTYE